MVAEPARISSGSGEQVALVEKRAENVTWQRFGIDAGRSQDVNHGCHSNIHLEVTADGAAQAGCFGDRGDFAGWVDAPPLPMHIEMASAAPARTTLIASSSRKTLSSAR